MAPRHPAFSPMKTATAGTGGGASTAGGASHISEPASSRHHRRSRSRGHRSRSRRHERSHSHSHSHSRSRSRSRSSDSGGNSGSETGSRRRDRDRDRGRGRGSRSRSRSRSRGHGARRHGDSRRRSKSKSRRHRRSQSRKGRSNGVAHGSVNSAGAGSSAGTGAGAGVGSDAGDGTDGLGPAITAEGQPFGTPAADDPLRLGQFVFMRNARFRVAAETPDMPRYWVARIIGTDPPTAGQSSDASSGGVSGIMPDTDVTRTAKRLFLRWHRETSLASGMYIPTNSTFAEQVRAVRALPGGLTFNDQLRVWQRPPATSTGTSPAPLVFPGDEALLADAIERHAQAAMKDLRSDKS